MYQTGIVFEGIQGCEDHFQLSDQRAVSSDLAFQNCIYLALEKKSKTKNSTTLQKKTLRNPFFICNSLMFTLWKS